MDEDKLDRDVKDFEQRREKLIKNVELMKKTGELEEVSEEKPKEFSLWDDTRKQTIPYRDKVMETVKYLRQHRMISETEKFVDKVKEEKEYDIFAEIDWQVLGGEINEIQNAVAVLNIPQRYYDSEFKLNPVRLMLEVKKTSDDAKEALKSKALNAIAHVMRAEELHELREKYGERATEQNFWKYVMPFIFNKLRQGFYPRPPRDVALVLDLEPVLYEIYASFDQSVQVSDADKLLQYRNMRGFEKYIKGLMEERKQFEKDKADAETKTKEADVALDAKKKELGSVTTQVNFYTDEEKRLRERVGTLNREIEYLQNRVAEEKRKVKEPVIKDEPSVQNADQPLVKGQEKEKPAQDALAAPAPPKKEPILPEARKGEITYSEGGKEYVILIKRKQNGSHVRLDRKSRKPMGSISEERFKQIQKVIS